jgi:hypothetical protein
MENKEYNNLNYGGGFTEEDIKRVSLFEQAANNWIKSTSEFLSVKNGFKAGAKWMQERMYSEEDVENILFRYAEEEHSWFSCKSEIESFNKWIKQFKKNKI